MTTIHHSPYTSMSFEIVFTRVEMTWPTNFWTLTLRQDNKGFQKFLQKQTYRHRVQTCGCQGRLGERGGRDGLVVWD